jgi:pimeloyl-ACP methyl ester carboxylesterase
MATRKAFEMQHSVRVLVIAAAALSVALLVRVSADDAERLLTIDHYVRVKSTVPAIAGQPAQLYVRERAKAGVIARGPSGGDRVALFVHGAGTPAEVSFDVPYQDYSWMAYLANADYDVFSVDMSGYGRSVRPGPMNDPCNLREEQQRTFIPRLLAAPCAAAYRQPLTTIASDWDDVGAAVDYVRALRHVEKVSLLAWSLGGPRSGGYAAQHPDKVNRLVLLAPAYFRTAAAPAAPSAPAAPPAAFNTQSHAEFVANWDRQVGCPAQYDQPASDSVWSEMLASDPVGATWGGGVRRAPNTLTTNGWTTAVVSKMQTPTLMVSGVHDKQVPQARVRDLYQDLGTSQKVFVDLACSSHNAMWERNHLLLFRASLEWLEKGTVTGQQQGMLRLGYGDHEGK